MTGAHALTGMDPCWRHAPDRYRRPRCRRPPAVRALRHYQRWFLGIGLPAQWASCLPLAPSGWRLARPKASARRARRARPDRYVPVPRLGLLPRRSPYCLPVRTFCLRNVVCKLPAPDEGAIDARHLLPRGTHQPPRRTDLGPAAGQGSVRRGATGDHLGRLPGRQRAADPPPRRFRAGQCHHCQTRHDDHRRRGAGGGSWNARLHPAQHRATIRNPGPEPLAFVSATAPPFDPDQLDPAFRYKPR